MEVVGPHRVQTVTTRLDRLEIAHVVLAGFGDEHGLAVGRDGGAHGLRQLGQDVGRRAVEDGVRRVQAQPVGVVFVDPESRILQDKPAHPLAVRSVVVDGLAPGRVVAIGEVIRAEVAQVVPVGSEMVVDHVEDDPEL